jgi:hypothetical protein
VNTVSLAHPERMRARRRPLAVLGVWLTELAWALVVATPAHAWARRSWGTHPDGDAVLWAPGSGDLLAWLGDDGAARAVVARSSVALLLVGLVLAQLPLGALLAALAFGRKDAPDKAPGGAFAAAEGVRSFRALGSLLVIGRVVQVAVVIAFALPARALAHALEPGRGEGPAFTARLVVTGVGVLLASALGPMLDVARAAAVQASVAGEASPARAALRALWRARGPELRGAIAPWAWRAALGLVLVAAGAKAADGLGGLAGSSFVVLVLAHQAVTLARTALRASWLARASEIAARARRDAPQEPEAQTLSDL